MVHDGHHVKRIVTLNQKIGARVGQLLEQRGKTKTWLADVLGVTRQHPGKLIRGEAVWTLANVEAVAQALHVDVADIISGAAPGLSAEEQALVAVFRVDGYHGVLIHAAARVGRT